MDVNQIEMVTVNKLVGENHPYRKLMASLNFKETQESVQIKKSFVRATGYDVPLVKTRFQKSS